MDANAQNRLRSASAPVPLDIFLNPSFRGFYQPQPVDDVYSGLRLTIPSPHVFFDYSSVPFPVQSYPPSPNTQPGPPRTRPHFPSASVSYPVLPVNAHKRASFREATLHTKNPLADTTTPSPSRPKLHLFASRKSAIVEHAKEDFPQPPMEWLIGATSSNESSSVSSNSITPSENASEDESDFVESTSPVPFEQYDSESGLEDSRSATCRDLSNGLKALLKVQA